MILAEPRHEPKVRQGVTTEIVGVDGNGFAPFARARGPRGVRRARRGARTDVRAIDVRLGLGRELPRALRRDGQRQRRRRSSATRRSGSMPSAGTTSPADAQALDRMRGLLREADGGGRRRALIRARLPAGVVRHDRGAGRAHRGGRSSRRLLSQPRPLHARRPLPRPVPRGDRDRPARRRARPHHPLLSPRDPPGPAEPLLALVDDARAEGLDVTFDTYPSEWASTRLLIQLPAWVQAGGPGPLKERLADRSARDRLRAASSRPAAPPTRARPAGRTSGSGRSRARTTCAGSRGPLAEVMDATGRDAVDAICDLLLAGGPGRQPGHERAVVEDPAAVRGAPGRDGRHGLDVPRREASTADLRLVPADPRPVRARRGAALASRRRSAR